MRNLNQDAGAIAGFRIAAAGAAVGQVDQDLDALADDVVGLLAIDAGDKADAAGVVLMLRIVKSLRSRDHEYVGSLHSMSFVRERFDGEQTAAAG